MKKIILLLVLSVIMQPLCTEMNIDSIIPMLKQVTQTAGTTNKAVSESIGIVPWKEVVNL